MKTVNYRESIQHILGPILAYSGYFVDESGHVQNGVAPPIMYAGRFLYVPEDGADLFKKYKSVTDIPFNPFIKQEHMAIVAKILCDGIADGGPGHLPYRDEDDDPDADIVTLDERHPVASDNLPSNFRGRIFEIRCRKEDVLATGIDCNPNDDMRGDSVRAILKAMLNFLIKVKAYPHPEGADTPIGAEAFFIGLFREIERIEHKKAKEYEVERDRSGISINDVEVAAIADVAGGLDDDDTLRNLIARRANMEMVSEDTGVFADVEFD